MKRILNTILPFSFLFSLLFPSCSTLPVPTYRKIWIVAMGVCPPWKPETAQTCSRDIQLISSRLSQKYGVPSERVLSFLNEEVTPSRVRNTLKDLSQRVFRQDTLIFYLAGHAMRAENSEVFALYTKEAPFSEKFAVAEDLWMTDRDLARSLAKVQTQAKVLILDACESGGAVKNVERVAHHLPNERIAVLASSGSREFSQASMDYSYHVFTQKLGNAIEPKKSLDDSAREARANTIALTIQNCIQISKKYPDFDCEAQHPVIHDPTDLLKEM